MRSLTIAGLMAALIVGTVVLLAAAPPGGPGPNRAPFWPGVKGQPVVQEWYSDLPWTQKLGTYRGNELDEALVLPYEALGDQERKYCDNQKTANPKFTDEECMLELGINNVLGTLRTDTLYNPQQQKIQAAAECKDPTLPCIEVKLELSSFWTRSTGSGPALQPRPFGTEPPKDDFYGGYTITDGSTYAPQMPWYMAHYCDAFLAADADAQDPVCYADYFSPMNSGFNALPASGGRTDWPRSVAWSVFPAASSGPDNHCKAGEKQCTLVMGGFDLREVSPNLTDLQYTTYNDFLVTWFNGALTNFFKDVSAAEDQRHFPWSATEHGITWETFLYPRAVRNPFLGQFATGSMGPPSLSADDCRAPNFTVNQNAGGRCKNTGDIRAARYLYPRQCNLDDLAAAAAGNIANVARLRQCGLNYELHHNGYLEQWPQSFWADIRNAGMIANQYGRTSFLFGGVPGLQMPVSFYKDPDSDSNLSVYERVHNASIFSLYLPATNVADTKRAMAGRNYTDKEFYHTLLMSNHMEADPWEFAEGIRGKVLWHNEYRTQKMYDAFLNGNQKFRARTFAAAFDPKNAPAPFHNYTCDGCHVRNGSGVPIKQPEGKLDRTLQVFMKDAPYDPYPVKDYTFTGTILPMKLVFFDLKRDTSGVDASRYSEPLAFPGRLLERLPRDLELEDLHYNNKIMNFYGDSFHVNEERGYGFEWEYEPASATRMVVTAARVNAELNTAYQPRQVKLLAFQTSPGCQLVLPAPSASIPWPATCDDINNDAIHAAINGRDLGVMLLNGKRLGNASAIEAIPNQAILGFRASQLAALGEKIAGEIIWNAGSRDGVGGKVQKVCSTKSLKDCYIGRFGWLGDRASLEDQVANAAYVEMNMTTSEGYKKLYSNDKVKFPIRYAHPNCGPANKTCVDSNGNADLSEADIDRMAAYARWVGNPTRSEFKVSVPEVIEGEKIFRQVKCDSCHVIRKIEIDPDDTMLSKVFRDRLATRVAKSARPFLSYIGTDLLMHDMGYLSQVGEAGESVRHVDGVVKAGFENYVQKIRTPALKGLRLNRFVTDSHKNTKNPGDPACDFLLHDGRACDAIEAAFLHDGPAIKRLGVIDALNGLTADKVRALRAFLYSL